MQVKCRIVMTSKPATLKWSILRTAGLSFGGKHMTEGLQNRFSALIAHSLDGIALVDARGTVLYASPSTQRVLG